MQQNGISKYDRYCPFWKSTGMLKTFMLYYDQAQKALDNGDTTWAKIREASGDEWHALTQMVRNHDCEVASDAERRSSWTRRRMARRRSARVRGRGCAAWSQHSSTRATG